jgi:hypothetical protein
MAVEKEPAWLAKPPPPRPARRDAAIEAALRKFDGIEEAPPRVTERTGPSWVHRHRGPMGLLVTASLVLVIGIPATMSGLRDRQPTVETPPPTAVVVHDSESSAAPAEQAPAADTRVAEAARPPARPTAPSAVRQDRARDSQVVSSNEPPAEAPAPVITLQAPPPPPAASASPAEPNAQPAPTNDVVVTGTRVPAPRKVGGVAERAPANDVASARAQAELDRDFLSRLQAAVRADDRSAIVGLIDFPLRVNVSGVPQYYRDPQSVKRDFERIFSLKVRQAILKQRSDRLFIRGEAAMIGNGEVWFGGTCRNAACSPAGPVRITAVAP